MAASEKKKQLCQFVMLTKRHAHVQDVKIIVFHQPPMKCLVALKRRLVRRRRAANTCTFFLLMNTICAIIIKRPLDVAAF